MRQCIHTLTMLYGTRCITCDRADMMKASVVALNESFGSSQPFCKYNECLVKYLEHYHITRYSLTFTTPERKEIKK